MRMSIFPQYGGFQRSTGGRPFVRAAEPRAALRRSSGVAGAAESLLSLFISLPEQAFVTDVRLCYWTGPRPRQIRVIRPEQPRLRLIDPLATLKYPTQIANGAGKQDIRSSAV